MAESTILVVEDERPLCELLDYNLGAAGFNVRIIHEGACAELSVLENPPDLAILDWMVPGISGIELCRRFRARKPTRMLPIIMLTARGEEADIVRGLDTGADDYITKPFRITILLARIKSLLRRSSKALPNGNLVAGPLELDAGARRITRDGRPLALSPTEFRIMELLMRAPGRVFERGQILDGAWGPNYFLNERTVDVHMGRLRRAVSHKGEQELIQTVRGAGYLLDLGNTAGPKASDNSN